MLFLFFVVVSRNVSQFVWVEGAKKFRWRVMMPPGPQNGTGRCTLGVYYMGKLGKEITFKFGDVWLCAGQSNMQRSISIINNGTNVLQEGE